MCEATENPDETIDTGGSAFPTRPNDIEAGMTLRDWLAGQALQGMGKYVLETAVVCPRRKQMKTMSRLARRLLEHDLESGGTEPEWLVARMAYRIADQAIEARRLINYST